MEKSKYLPIMLQSLKKKDQILTAIIQINQQQKEELENPSLDPDDFDKTFQKKAELIDSLEELDNGFQQLFERVRDELNENKDAYREEIAEMQEYIRRLTEKSAEFKLYPLTGKLSYSPIHCSQGKAFVPWNKSSKVRASKEPTKICILSAYLEQIFARARRYSSPEKRTLPFSA